MKTLLRIVTFENRGASAGQRPAAQGGHALKIEAAVQVPQLQTASIHSSAARLACPSTC